MRTWRFANLSTPPAPLFSGDVRGELWRKDRIETELLLHVLHAIGIIRWIQ